MDDNVELKLKCGVNRVVVRRRLAAAESGGGWRWRRIRVRRREGIVAAIDEVVVGLFEAGFVEGETTGFCSYLMMLFILNILFFRSIFIFHCVWRYSFTYIFFIFHDIILLCLALNILKLVVQSDSCCVTYN